MAKEYWIVQVKR